MKKNIAALIGLLIVAAFFAAACNKAPQSVELTLAQATAINAKALAAVGEAYDVALFEGLITMQERDDAFRELRPILEDSKAITALLDDATSLSKNDLDRLIAFFDRSAAVFSRLATLQRLPDKARAALANGSAWVTRISAAARIVVAAIQPAAKTSERLASRRFFVDVKGLPAVKSAKDLDTGINRLTSIGVQLVVDVIRLAKADVLAARQERAAAFGALDQRLKSAGL